MNDLKLLSLLRELAAYLVMEFDSGKKITQDVIDKAISKTLSKSSNNGCYLNNKIKEDMMNIPIKNKTRDEIIEVLNQANNYQDEFIGRTGSLLPLVEFQADLILSYINKNNEKI